MIEMGTFRGYLAAYVPDCPNPQIDRQTVLAARELCESAPIWVADLEPIGLAAGQDIATLSHAEGEVVRPVKYGVRIDGAPLRHRSATQIARFAIARQFTMRDARTLILAPAPEDSATLSVRAQLRPRLDATALARVIADDWREALVHGALARLLDIPGTHWADANAAARHLTLFERKRAQAIAAHYRGYERGVGRVTPASDASNQRSGY